ncbi:phenol hydroxylase subunit P4 [Aquabacterium sp. OR-4]|uniref:phenol hydroxylase subunit P4 n=1 Tax=Aquabacterium sp. OR-4 TaxID=2978127 RepID=UPI0021B42D4D|nr:phenol hydroxylase subunit P4 [Aquabacterium sp. OR-4]MDT7837048.1 phenol hydroxylase subunit P4 [Aquabacterium sp. OR-4]
MTVQAISPDYHGSMKDSVEHFHGQQLLNIGWDQHLMFATPLCIPVPPGMPFGALVQQVLPGLYGQHPQFAQIDWAATEWLRSGERFTPAMDQSLADNGLGHKAVLRFRTPGLAGLAGAAF